jgi:hypothetical protein
VLAEVNKNRPAAPAAPATSAAPAAPAASSEPAPTVTFPGAKKN